MARSAASGHHLHRHLEAARPSPLELPARDKQNFCLRLFRPQRSNAAAPRSPPPHPAPCPSLAAASSTRPGAPPSARLVQGFPPDRSCRSNPNIEYRNPKQARIEHAGDIRLVTKLRLVGHGIGILRVNEERPSF